MQKLSLIFLVVFLLLFLQVPQSEGAHLEEVQRILTKGSTDCESFVIDGDTFLAVINGYTIVDGSVQDYLNSKIYKWNGDAFVEFQAFPALSAGDWEFFTIADEHYLTLTSYGAPSGSLCKIYKWNGLFFEQYGTLIDRNITCVESYIIEGEVYLAAGGYNFFGYSVDSYIYKWNQDAAAFERYQSIPTVGATDVEWFSAGDDIFLAVANYYDGNTFLHNSNIYKWNTDTRQFDLFQNILTSGVFDFEGFTIDGTTYLAVANTRPSAAIFSELYKFNGDEFVKYQEFVNPYEPLGGTNNFEHFTFEGRTYLAASNPWYTNLTPDNTSIIYVWNGSDFEEYISIKTYQSTDWEILTIDDALYLANVNFAPLDDTVIYKWVNDNNPPILDAIGDKYGVEGQVLEFVVTAHDEDGDILTFGANNLPDDATFDTITGTFSWVPGFDQAGNFENVEFYVMDNGDPVEIDAELITITIGNVNKPPSLSNPGPQEVLENNGLEFSISVSDPDGDDIIDSWTSEIPPGANASFDSVANRFTFSWVPGYDQAGNYTIAFYAIDGGDPNLTGQAEVVITVGDVPTPPEQADDLAKTITGLELPKDEENAYLANLKKVGIFIEDGKITPALNQLDAFIVKVEQDVLRGDLDEQEGDFLIERANTLIAALSI